MKRFTLHLLNLACVAGLASACTEGAVGMNESPAWHLTASAEQKADFYGKRCAAVGLVKGTPGYANCVLSFWNDSSSAAHDRFKTTNVIVNEGYGW